MTIDDAIKIAAIVAEADGGCSNCVGHLVDLLNEAFPDFVWAMADDWDKSNRVDVTPKHL